MDDCADDMRLKNTLEPMSACEATSRTTKRIFPHTAVGKIENACVNNDGRTQRWKPR